MTASVKQFTDFVDREGAERMTGVITRLVKDRETGASRGFGFIRADGSEFFFHRSGLERTTKAWNDLHEGDLVEFTPIVGEKGPRAIEVRIV